MFNVQRKKFEISDSRFQKETGYLALREIGERERVEQASWEKEYGIQKEIRSTNIKEAKSEKLRIPTY
jgi:hypothetical protein